MTPDRLIGWKEISGHLRVSVRTAQRLAKAGLPVRRTPALSVAGHTKERVYAFASELDAWLSNHPVRNAEESLRPDEPPQASSLVAAEAAVQSYRPHSAIPRGDAGNRRPLIVALVLLAAAAPAGYLYSVMLQRNPVAATVVSENRFAAYGAAGNLLWSHRFEEGLKPDATGQDHRWEIADLDGDGKSEVVFAPHLRHFDPRKERLLCYSARGALLWQFAPGGASALEGADAGTGFRISNLTTGKLGKGQRFIVLVSNHNRNSSSQVAVLSHHGGVITEYWHAGRIFTTATRDFDGDGEDEIVLGGVDSVRGGRGFLAVIRARPAASAVRTAAEMAYVLFPRSDVADLLALDMHVTRLSQGPEGELVVALQRSDNTRTHERVFYLDDSLRATRMEFLQSFVGLHAQLRAEGKLDHDLGEHEERQLMALETVVPPVYDGFGVRK